MKKGDFIEVDFVGRVSLTGEIFDLTLEDVARENNLYSKDHAYKPVLVIIGNGMVIPGVEKELEGMKVGEEKEFEVQPEHAFGKRSQKLVKIVSLAKFTKEKINPVPGAFMNIDGVNAKIQSVSGGRVMVDFNHPLAGRALKYKIRIVGQIEDTLEKARAMLSHYGMKCTAELREGALVLAFDKPVNNVLKEFLKKSLTEWIREIKDVQFEEKEAKTEGKKG